MPDIEPPTDLIPHVEPLFDLARPIEERTEWLMSLLEGAAHTIVERMEHDNPNAPWVPQKDDTPEAMSRRDTVRKQEVNRQTFSLIQSLRQCTNMAEVRWAMENGHQTWLDENGRETDLLEQIEHLLPGEELRRNSGRARQIWAFVAGQNSAVSAFREQGIPDWEIAKAGASGMPSVLGILSAERKKLEDITPPDELPDTYREFIEEASQTTRLDDLKDWVRKRINPTDQPPPRIPYSVEPDGEDWWLVAHPSAEQFTELILRRLRDVLELDKQLPEWFTRYWRSALEDSDANP
jgi:hypothetical protein